MSATLLVLFVPTALFVLVFAYLKQGALLIRLEWSENPHYLHHYIYYLLE